MKKIKFYYHLYTTDRAAFRYQLWMVYNRYRGTVVVAFFYKLSSWQKSFVTIHTRPFTSTKVGTWSDPLTTLPPIAIVLQGPINTDRNFTLETVRLYKKTFPNAYLIVSTRDDTPEANLTALRAENITIIKADTPVVKGWGNVNLQMATVNPGLQAAKAAGAQYVYKTRTDQRMYGVNVSEFLINLIEAFPVVPGYTQRCRIIASSFLTNKFVPYLITDMFQFGQIDDMIDFWDAPADTRTAVPPVAATIKGIMENRIAEMYLVTEYMKRLGRPLKWTLEDSWHVYADHFCIVDRETLDLFWNKYDLFHEYQMKDYTGVSNGQLLTFAEWFNLYRNFKNKAHIPEETLDCSRHGYVPPPVTQTPA